MIDDLTSILPIALFFMVIQCVICHFANNPGAKIILPILTLPIFFFSFLFVLGGSFIGDYIAGFLFMTGIIINVGLFLGYLLSSGITLLTTEFKTNKKPFDPQEFIASIKRGIIGFSQILHPMGIVSFIFFFAYLFSMRKFGFTPFYINLSRLSVADHPFGSRMLTDTGVGRLLFFFCICLLLFLFAMFIRAFVEYNFITWLGFAGLLLAGVISCLAYLIMPRAFPGEQSYQYASYNVITFGITILILASFYLIAIGYFKKEEIFSLGVLSFAAAIFTTIFVGMYIFELMMHNPEKQFGAAANLAIYVPMIYIFCLSFAYTFRMKGYE